VAHFFKYKSVADLVVDNTRLGLDLRFTEDFSPLFTPVSIGPLCAGNAWCIQPMEGCDGTLDGRPDELTYRRYERFGAGGAKLIWGEATAVVEEARANTRQLFLSDATASALEDMLARCKLAHRRECGTDSDLVVGLQLTHSGRYSCRKPLIAVHDPLLDPRTIVDKSTGKAADASFPVVNDDYLKGLVDAYVSAARLAHRIGFDFVDVKQCHRYLLNELLGARTRSGLYGGSLENRTRLARDIFTAIRSEVPKIVLATRLGAFDCIPFNKRTDNAEGTPAAWSPPVSNVWGTRLDDPFTPDLTEVLWWIGEMRKLGVQLVNVSMGNPYASPHVIRPFEYPPPDGYETPEHPLIGVDRHFKVTAQLQQAFPDLPLVGSGYSYLQEFIPHAGAANIREGRVHFVGVGRAAFSQPDIALQVQRHGKLDRKRICRTFSYCTALMRSKHNELGQFPTGCPPFDKDVYGPIWDEARNKEK